MHPAVLNTAKHGWCLPQGGSQAITATSRADLGSRLREASDPQVCAPCGPGARAPGQWLHFGLGPPG